MASALGPRSPGGSPEQVAASSLAPLYHAKTVPAFHFDADTVTLMFASALPTGDGRANVGRAELFVNLGIADFERLLRRLIEVRAALVDAGVIERPGGATAASDSGSATPPPTG